jgi:hypothetical protein
MVVNVFHYLQAPFMGISDTFIKPMVVLLPGPDVGIGIEDYGPIPPLRQALHNGAGAGSTAGMEQYPLRPAGHFYLYACLHRCKDNQNCQFFALAVQS